MLLIGCARPGETHCTLGRDAVTCTSANYILLLNEVSVCADVILVSRETGEVVRDVACSPELAWGEHASFVAKVPPPRELCGDDLRGCAFRTFLGDRTAEKLAFIRGVQEAAPNRSYDHPSVGECQMAVIGWRASPGITRAFGEHADEVLACTDLTRERFECMRDARTNAALAACVELQVDL